LPLYKIAKATLRWDIYDLKNDFLYTRVNSDGESCNNKDLGSNNESTYYNQFILFFISLGMSRKPQEDCLRLHFNNFL
jgi:hypothetical protein